MTARRPTEGWSSPRFSEPHWSLVRLSPCCLPKAYLGRRTQQTHIAGLRSGPVGPNQWVSGMRPVFHPSPLCPRSVSPAVARHHLDKPHSPTHRDTCPIRPPTRGTSRHVPTRSRHASWGRCAPPTHLPVSRDKTRHTQAAGGSKNPHRTPAATGRPRRTLSSSEYDQRLLYSLY